MQDYRRPNKRRIAAVLNGELPDRVPNFEVLVDNPTFGHVMGRHVAGGHTLANIDPADYIEFVSRIGQDVVGMCFYDSPFRCVDPARQLGPLDFKIKSRGDLARVKVTDLSHLEPQFALLDRYARSVEGSDIGLFVLLGSFFTDTYTTIFGFEHFMVLVHEDRDLVEEVLEQYTAYYVSMAERLVDYPLTFFYVGDDLAYKTSTLVRPQLLREIWVPRMQRVFELALRKRIPIVFHSDGNIEALIPDLLEMGVCALNPIEPYGMDIRKIKKCYGRHLALIGNMDVGGALSHGTPEQVRAEARQLVDDVGQDGGFVLASCHSITPNVKPENFLAMVDTAQTYGIYS
ncbi:MAG: uroporphyrinogen decarboxylase family protein [Anaerolineae bacterium]